VLTDPTQTEVQIQIRASLRGAGPALCRLRILGERAANR
jgi:hypothetical protein